MKLLSLALGLWWKPSTSLSLLLWLCTLGLGGTRHIASFFCSIFKSKPCEADTVGLGGFATENRISEFLSANLCSHLLSYSASP